MTKIQPVKKLAGYNMTLYEEVKSLRCPVEHVRKLYGDIGVDIYEGRTPTILSEQEIKDSKKLINRIKHWWSGMGLYEYEPKDRLRDVILKYGCNKQTGKVEDIKKIFGDDGVSELEIMRKMGFVYM